MERGKGFSLKSPQIAQQHGIRCILATYSILYFKVPAMSGDKSPRMYDSMAQAYHLLGQHDLAAETQRMALHFLGDDDSPLGREMSERLQGYLRAAERTSLEQLASREGE